MNIEQRLLAALIKIKQDGPKDLNCGICSNAQELVDPYECSDGGMAYHLISAYSVEWPKFSGDKLYPIPSPTGNDPMDEYDYSDDLWTGAYGELRYELLDFLINELTIKIGEE